MVYESLVLLSEVVLSAYPLLIKRVDASVFFQTGLRMWIFTVLAAGAAAATGSPLAAASLWSVESLATGFLNLVHVGASYTAFEQLPAGNAMALFYTYPVFNIIGAAALLGESVPLSNIPWMILAFGGAVMLAQPTATNWTLVGVVCALIAALTETFIYLWFKTRSGKEPDTQPWTKMIQMYGSSGVLWALLAIGVGVFMTAKNTFRMSSGGLASIVLFNTFVGFTGYALRFFLIPRVSTTVFSVLSFFGVVSAYVLGWLFQGETPNLVQMAGAAAIVLANGVLMSKENS